MFFSGMNFHLKISLFYLGLCTFTAAMYCKLNTRVCLAYISTGVPLHHFSTGLESIMISVFFYRSKIALFVSLKIWLILMLMLICCERTVHSLKSTVEVVLKNRAKEYFFKRVAMTKETINT